jgi:Protein of unknown function (DUF4435)
VEGNDDSIFFQLIKDELIKKSNENNLVDLTSIEIETPVCIKAPDGEILGNRGKIELICNTADQISFRGLLLGFVDREFREFALDGKIQDILNSHNKVGRVIWSRGHSLENYFFEFEKLRDGLRDYGINSSYPIVEVLDLFKFNFDEIVDTACAISLSAKKNSLIEVIENSLDSSIFDFTDNQIKFNLTKWDHFLYSKKKLDESRRTSLIVEFNNFSTMINDCEDQTTRWLCHGHIGIKFIYSAFEACIIRICDMKNVSPDERRIRKVNYQDRFVKFSSQWIKDEVVKSRNVQDMPFQCFYLLLDSNPNV